MAQRTCSIEGCEAPHLARGFCNLHYSRWRRHGDPERRVLLVGPEHPNWKGDAVGYKALHQWVRLHRGAPEQCEHCGCTETVEWANRSQTYQRDLDDWLALCRPCHRTYDRKTTCREGHPRTEENTYVDPRGYPQCRACKNANWNRNYHKRKAAACAS